MILTESISIYQPETVTHVQNKNFSHVPEGDSVWALIKDCTMPFPNMPSHLAPNPAAVMNLVA